MFYTDKREERISVFNNTLYLCKHDDFLKKSVENSIKNQKLISENGIIEGTASKYTTKAEIIVSKKRSFEASKAYIGQKTCVHNFASATNAGGGVTKGSNAQEEALCRCSTLYPCISQKNMINGFYNKHRTLLKAGDMNSLYNDDCIYTPDVIVFKTDDLNPLLMDKTSWYNIDIITCAAPNLRERPSNYMNPSPSSKPVKISDLELKKLHEKRANRILDIAKANGCDVVILGAFGCGAFKNAPRIVAQGICEAVKKHIYDFKTIEFAIYCSERDKANYEEFKKVFNKI